MSLPPFLNMELLKRLAKKLDTPEMRKLYRQNQADDNSFDQTIDELTEELKDLLKHKDTPDED